MIQAIFYACRSSNLEIQILPLARLSSDFEGVRRFDMKFNETAEYQLFYLYFALIKVPFSRRNEFEKNIICSLNRKTSKTPQTEQLSINSNRVLAVGTEYMESICEST